MERMPKCELSAPRTRPRENEGECARSIGGCAIQPTNPKNEGGVGSMAGLTRRDARLAEALVIVGGAHALAPRDLRVAREVFDHEAAAHDRGHTDGAPQRDDLPGVWVGISARA